MSSDDFDKTVFKQPMPGGDRTVMRPMPGGRRAPAGQPAAGAASAAQQSYGSPLPTQASPAPAMDASAAYFRTGRGLNPLVNAASTLIAVFEKTRQSMNHPDIAGLHQRMINEIRAFEQSSRDLGFKPEVILAARYILCSALDEAVLNTPWGSESAWAQKTLLSVFHNETSGGEKFFLILDRMRQSPAENLDFLELGYIFLSLGFEGRYRLSNRGKDAIEQVKAELFKIIRSYRGEYERTLSTSWQGLGKTRNALTEYVPMWVVASLVAAVLFFSYSGFRYWLYNSSTPVAEQLAEIASPPADVE